MRTLNGQGGVLLALAQAKTTCQASYKIAKRAIGAPEDFYQQKNVFSFLLTSAATAI
jgi:hypothetical protein